MNIRQKLSIVQKNLVANKGQTNSFGKYSYRSCEDILEALKPHLDGCTVTLSDDIIMVGDRIYVRSTATFADDSHAIDATAFAREPLSRKGMDDAQLTGATGSYSRKYALNGLFGIDDVKDADTMDSRKYETLKAKVGPVDESANAILELIANPDISESEQDSGIHEVWSELTRDEQTVAWRAISKGGYFTQEQKDLITRASASAVLNSTTADKEQAA
jgi:hypothetical protein